MKKWWWLPMVLLLLPGIVRADGMVIPKPMRTISETGQRAVIWYEGGTETLILSTTFRGDAEEFAWIVPVPARPDVAAGKDELFTALSDYTSPKYRDQVPLMGVGSTFNAISEAAPTPAVRVLETKKVGIFETAVLEAGDAGALTKWLVDNGYEYPTNREMLLKHYIDKKWYFVAAKVAGEELGYAGSALNSGHATPLSLTFATPQIVYPLKISGLGSRYNEAEKIGAFGFENGMQGWSGGVVSRDQAKQGGASLKLTASQILPTPATTTGVNRATAVYERNATRTVAGMKKGTQYVFSAYLMSESASGKAKLKVQSGAMQEVSEELDLNDLDKWTRLDLPFVPYDNGTVTLSVVVRAEKGEEVVYADAIQLEMGDEPSEFAAEILPSVTTNTLNEKVSLQLYVFADHKKYLPGWNTEYAGDVPTKDITRMAVNEDGSPWREPKKAMYLTKLTKSMKPEEMTDDLTIRDAQDNLAVGGVNQGLGGNWRPVLVFGLLIGLELFALGYYWYHKNRRREK